MIDWAAFNRARGYLSGRRAHLVAAGICAVITALCSVALVLVLGLLAELVLAPQHGLSRSASRLFGYWGARLDPDAQPGVAFLEDSSICFVLLVAVAILLAVVRAACQYAQSWLTATAVADALNRMRRAIYRQAYRLGTTEMSGIGAAPAVNVFTRETDAVRNGLLAWLDGYIRDPLQVGLLLVMAMVAHPALCVLFLLLAGLGTFLARRLIQRARARARAATRVAAERLALLQESLQMIRLSRCYLMESYEQERFEHNLRQFTAAEARALHASEAVQPVIRFVAFLCVTLVAGLASYNLLMGELSALATGVLYASLVSLYWPMRGLAQRYAVVRQGAASAAAVFSFLDQHSRLGEIAGASFLPPMSRNLQFIGVRLEEPEQPPVLDGIDLVIPTGSHMAIMGLDERAIRGLVYLIPRFLDPTAGEVRIDGQDIRLVTLESLRAQLALVLQGELVFNDTVAGNIGCGDPSYGLPHIVDAAKVAHVHNFVQRLPQGYDTLIGDQGETLTVGQQFRIALARAILRDPTVVVIEEPRVHLDNDTKTLLDDTLARFSRGRTMIFLPHRLSTIRSCHSIVLLHNGKIETTGSHHDLTQGSELYRHLQYTEFNVYAAG